MTISSPQINLHLTDWVSEINKNDNIGFQHDCLHVAASNKKNSNLDEIISYCLTELPSKWNIQENNFNQKFTFDELFKQNITSQQLYIWSAPMDVIERYQLYLNQPFTSNETQLFYNCTLPRFGPLCQYELDIYEHHYSSLNEIIYNFYQYPYDPINLTCYIHLKCNRGSTLSCLDWTEICNGYIDCLNNGVDEENCWQIEIHQCKKDEYRCNNGLCIHEIFLYDNKDTFECLDLSDELGNTGLTPAYFIDEPTFAQEDVICFVGTFMFHMKYTTSCVDKRSDLLKQMMFVDKPSSINETCWLASKCHFEIESSNNPICDYVCHDEPCQKIINETCPDIYFLTDGALAFGHINFIYFKNTTMVAGSLQPPEYVCYNNQLCGGFYSNSSLLIFNNMTCRHPDDFPLNFFYGGRRSWQDIFIYALYQQLYQCNTIIHNYSAICNSSTMYQCINSSKCISLRRLCDDIIDCDYKDDEQCSLINGTCSITTTSENLFKCTNNNICISLKRINNLECDCGYDEYGLCADEITNHDYIRKHISFSTICDGYTELSPVLIDGQNETDETECEYWVCNNIYTRCNSFWNCFNGEDEINCDLSLLLKCPFHHHKCVSFDTYKLICLSIEKINDGNIDCLGATDEPKLCRSNGYQLQSNNFYCKNDTIRSCIHSNRLCDNKKDCVQGDDEYFCNQTQNNNKLNSVCRNQNKINRTDVEKFLCGRLDDTKKPQIINFTIDKSIQSVKQITIEDKNTYSSIISSTHQYEQRCHRGIPIHIWLNSNKNVTIKSCLCPPSFYGSQCQYQNQRVSLTIKFQTYSDSRRTLFSLIILLIDDSNQRIIHSYQQLIYLYTQHCRTKFNIYLLYSTRPKLQTNNYSIHIDIYEKISFKYRGSFLIPLNYSFLPVHRSAVQINIPRTSDNIEHCFDLSCVHGHCIRYMNDLKYTSFCQCNQGWSGKYCTIQYKCICSSDSLCIGVSSNNRSICICPINKWGSRCLLQSTICQLNQNLSCQNNGQCISINENIVSNKQFICNCQQDFSGERCEIIDNKIIISFHKNISLPEIILIHFIRVIDNVQPENGSTFKTLPFNQNSVIIRWSRPFHIAFVELFINQYYLITVQKIYNQSTTIVRSINPSDRCKYISEVLNETIVKYHLIRRIKYYHLACQIESLLSCFYDDNHFCLCNDQHVANCFEFNSSIKHDCFGESNCENNAQCLQDKPTCPQTSICVCPPCFYGKRCQFSSTLFGLSLDAILGYYIKPHVNMKHQPSIVKISVALTTIIVIVGLINGVLSLITFINKELHKVGCGLYLFGSSITTLFTITILAFKFFILIITQMTYNINRSFLRFQCHSIDFLLRICLNIDQWLNACVAMERAFTVIKGVYFDKKKSKQIAKYIIVVLIILNISTIIHDPIHRRLLDDDDSDDEKRIWCIITYSANFQIYNTFINIFHFFSPFILNVISAIVIIVLTAQQRISIERNQTYRRILREQIQQHRQLLIAPIILIILAVPRLIISFVSGCMKSTSNTWLFLFGYFISFIPPMLTFIVFVIPSKLYKQEFQKTIKRYRQIVRIRVEPFNDRLH